MRLRIAIGKVFEGDFVTLAKYKATGLREALTNPDLGKKLKPRLTVEGEDCKFHHYRGGSRPDHQCGVILEDQAGEVVRLVFHKSPQEMAADQGKKWQISVEADCRVPALVSLIKAAYLTLFRLLGYPYALSASGLSVGHGILGDFYQQNREKSVPEIKEAARTYFQQYVHMVRPIERTTGEPPLGTIEDRRAMACFGSSGRPFALVVCVRTNQDLYAVLMPAFVHPDSVAAYHEFLNNDRESLRANECVFDPEKHQWEGYEQPIEMVWLKESGTFELER